MKIITRLPLTDYATITICIGKFRNRTMNFELLRRKAFSLFYLFIRRDWYTNASCRNYYRRRPLQGAFTHPSKMVYPPGEFYTPEPTPEPARDPRKRGNWEDKVNRFHHPDYELGLVSSESQ